MFQVTSPPAAVQVLLKMALSPLMRMCFLVTARVLSKSVAVLSNKVFSLNLRAVSFTTANASGKISNKISSIFLSLSFLSASIS